MDDGETMNDIKIRNRQKRDRTGTTSLAELVKAPASCGKSALLFEVYLSAQDFPHLVWKTSLHLCGAFFAFIWCEWCIQFNFAPI